MQKDPAVKAFYLAHFNAAAKPDLTHWHDAKKKAVMLQALRAKFSCIPAMRALLLGTGDAVLVERTPRDSYWGDGLGKGKNMLGQLLVQVRTELRSAARRGAEPN